MLNVFVYWLRRFVFVYFLLICLFVLSRLGFYQQCHWGFLVLVFNDGKRLGCKTIHGRKERGVRG